MTTTTSSPISPDTIHPEDRELIQNLAKLQSIHDQMHHLRGLLPERLLKPTRLALEDAKGNSPTKTAGLMMLAASEGSADIKRFKRDFRSEEMQDLWGKVGGARFPQGRDTWTRDYQAMIKGDGGDGVVGGGGREGGRNRNEVVVGEGREDVNVVVEAFKEANPNVKVDSQAEEAGLFPLDVLVNRLAFRVVKEESDGRGIYHVDEVLGKAPLDLSKVVLKFIKDSGPHTRLNVLLSMLASYQDLQSRHCDRCHDLFDDDLSYPIVRKRKGTPNTENNTMEWSAYHLGCVP